MRSSRETDRDREATRRGRPEAEDSGGDQERMGAASSRVSIADGGRADQPSAADERGDAASQADELTAELARIEDRYRRALADLDNYRKRAAREAGRQIDDLRESMLVDWLDAVDSVERAIQMEPTGPCRDGLEAVLGQMDAVLRRQGAQRVGAAGERFDPERHDAIAVRAADEVPDQTVVEVSRSGFALGDRVIRPAQVVVARAAERAR
jgi:molecular chaperone GrpE